MTPTERSRSWQVWLVFGALVACGCNDLAAPGQPAAPANSSSPAQAPPAVSRPSPEQIASWLATDLPPIAEDVAKAPVKLSEPSLTANEFGQEILAATYERPAVVRTLAGELSLVLLPSPGGRIDVSQNPHVLLQPQGSGKLRGITRDLLDHRGRLRFGMRAYLEMRAATFGGSNKKPERVSEVVWFGSDDQLLQAIHMGAPFPVVGQPGVPPIDLQPAPSGKIERGTPLWMQCGDRWTRGNGASDNDAGNVQLLIYLVRRDRPYLPWLVELPRSELRIEAPALAEFRSNPHAFHDLAEGNDLKLARQGVPQKLVPVNAADLPTGAAVLDFWNGLLDPCRVTGPVQGDSVPIQRAGLDNAKMVKSAKGLFVDPFGD
jgi:hypothetical protein